MTRDCVSSLLVHDIARVPRGYMIRRTVALTALLVFQVILGAPAALAQSPVASAAPVPSTAPAHPVANGPDDAAIRERLARLEEGMKARQDEGKRADDAQTKLKDRLDGAWPASWTAVSTALTTMLAWVAFIFAYAFPRLRKDIESRGRQAIVEAAVETLLKEDSVRMTAMFEAYRKTIIKIVMAKDRAVLLLGEDDEKPRIKAMLEAIGHSKFVESAADAGLIMLVGDVACVDQIAEVEKSVREQGDMSKVVVLFTRERFDMKLAAGLNSIATVALANFPATAVNQLATLGMTTQRLQK